MLNVSERTVRSVKAVERDGIPSLIDKVYSGKVAVSKAAQIAKLSPEEQEDIFANC